MVYATIILFKAIQTISRINIAIYIFAQISYVDAFKMTEDEK